MGLRRWRWSRRWWIGRDADHHYIDIQCPTCFWPHKSCRRLNVVQLLHGLDGMLGEVPKVARFRNWRHPPAQYLIQFPLQLDNIIATVAFM